MIIGKRNLFKNVNNDFVHLVVNVKVYTDISLNQYEFKLLKYTIIIIII